jgi:guanylate kinase
MIDSNEMIEYAQYNNHFYGTPRKFVEKKLEQGCNVVLEIEVQGAQQVHKLYPEALMIFVIPLRWRSLKKGWKADAPKLPFPRKTALLRLQKNCLTQNITTSSSSTTTF